MHKQTIANGHTHEGASNRERGRERDGIRQWNGQSDTGRGGSDLNNRLANGLGWFSIGLGMAEVVAPGMVAHMAGLPDERKTRTLLRFSGFRELASGFAILSTDRPAKGLWSRVGGDMVALATLGKAMTSGKGDRTRVVAATAAVVGVTALDLICAQKSSEGGSGMQSKTDALPRVCTSILINRNVEDVYAFWRDFQNLPRFMRYLESVRCTGERRSHWVAAGPMGPKVEWDADIIQDQPNSFISWRSVEGSDVYNAGSVIFERAPGNRGTLLKVDMEYAPPGGTISRNLAKLFNAAPQMQVQNELRAVKQILEIGEVLESDASIHPGMHAAQPTEQTIGAR